MTKKELIKTLYEKGWSYAEIGRQEEINLTRERVRQICRRFPSRQTITQKSHQKLVEIIEKHPEMSLLEISAKFGIAYSKLSYVNKNYKVRTPNESKKIRADRIREGMHKKHVVNLGKTELTPEYLKQLLDDGISKIGIARISGWSINTVLRKIEEMKDL